MSIKTLRIKKAVSAAFVVLLLLVAGLSQAKAQDITVGNLNYTINEDGTTVTLTGHVDGTNATGELVIPASVEYYGNSYAVTSIANSAFYNCTGFTGNLVIPNSVITIGVSAFYSCTGFTGSLTIPNSVTQINARAFQYCSGLSGTLTIPESVTWIGLIAFYGAEFSVLNFNAINCNLTWDDVCVDPDCWTWGYFNSFGGLTAVSTLNIGENVQVIPYCAFRNFSNLTGNLVIPNSVTSIGNYAFEYCSGLSGTLTIPDGLTAIGNSAFHECTGFTGSLDIPNSVAQVGSNAFNGCSGLTGALTIGNGVTQIYENAFANTGFTALNFNAVNCATFNSSWLTGVTTLTSLSIGDQVRRIPDGFLTDFSGITGELTIPNAVTYIGSSAFANCTGLSGTLTLGMSLTEIGNSAFFGSCANLTSVVVRTQVPPTLGSNVFTSAPADIPVEVPCGTLTAYQEASVWGNFVNLQETDPCEWVISTAVNPAEGGTVAGAGIYIQGQTCTLTATSNADYAFVNWTEDGEEVCTDAVYAFTVSSSRNLVANFRYIRYDITASVYAGLGGSVSGGGSFLEGETCTLVATPDEDYVFVNWTLNGEEVSTEAEFVFTVTSDGHYVANFRYNIFTVSYSAIPPTGGSVTINQVAHSMDYYFDFESGFQGWTTIDADGDGYDWSISDPVNHYVFPGHNSNRCVSSASYINYVGALSPNNYLVSPQFFLGGSITFYARAKDATYSSEHFGVAVSTTGNQVSDFTMVQEWTMTAKHSAIDDGVPRGSRADGSWYQYTVDLSNFSGPGYVAIRHFNCYDMYWLNVDDITIVSEGSANVSQFSGGETCTLTATPNQGWEFYGWCENGELITTNTQYSFVVASDHYLTARFKKPNTIDFVDPQVEAICVRNWDTDGDGFLSYDEAAAVTDLGNAFSNNGSISSFDEMQYFTGLTSLVDYAFANCENMSSITLPPYLEIIGEGAFWYCRSLGEIVLPESITSIGYNAFYYCQNLVEITIPESVTSIGSYAFRYCSSLTVVNYNAAYIAGDGQYWRWFCDCPSLSTINIGENVTSIPSYVFYGLGLTTVNFNAKNCTSMWRCFDNCQSLTTLNIGEQVQIIPNYAFFNCSGLTGALALPNTVTSIGNYAFRGCSGYTGNLTIPNNVTSIGSYAFYECSGLTGSLTIPEPITSIGDYAFVGTGFTTLNFNAVNCTYMGDYYSPCFRNCNSLTTLNLGQNVQIIPDYAFQGLSNLTGALTLPNTITSIGSYAFENCSGFTGTLVLPNNISAIGYSAFAYCTGLTGTLTIPESVTYIGSLAFALCDFHVLNFNAINCEDFEYPESIYLDGVWIGGVSVFGCGEGLTELHIGNQVQRIPSWSFGSRYSSSSSTFVNNAFTGELVIPNSVVEIGRAAFQQCTGFTGDLVIPNAVEWISQEAFYKCTGFEGSLTIGTGLENMGSAFKGDRFSQLYYNAINCLVYDAFANALSPMEVHFGNQVEALSDEVFSGCTHIVGEVVLPNSLKSIGNQAFYNCYGIESLVMGSSVETIGAEAFRNCGGIRGEITLPETLQTVGNYAFASCDEISTINYQATNCTTMGNAQQPVFYDCASIEHINISANVQSIPNYAFKRCSTVTDMSVAAIDPPVIEASTFGTVSRSIPVTVPFGSGNVYRNTQYWSEFFNIIEGIGQSPYNNHWLVNVNQYPNNMTAVGVIEIDGVEQTSEALEIGAFCGDECRGSQLLTHYPQLNRSMVFFTIFGEPGDLITFRLYNHELEEESVLGCATVLTFEADGRLGTYANPYAFNFGYIQNTLLNEGWTWYSSYVELNGANGLQMMENGLGQNGLMIKSQSDGFVTYDEFWMGSLQAVNSESMYLVNVGVPTVLSMAANFVAPAQHPITLAPGWTWMGYPMASAADIEDAFANLTPVDNDMVKSQRGFATYAEGIGWVGSLNTLTPGAGLMYHSLNNQPQTFAYSEGAKGVELRENLTAEGNRYMPQVSAYPHNMNMVAVVELEGVEARDIELELSAFVGNECRGSIRLLYVEALDRYLAFLTVSGNEAGTLTMRLVDAETGMEYESEQQFEFEPDAILGTVKQPVVLRFNTVVTQCESYLSQFELYPNPVKGNEMLRLNMPVDKEVRVELVNALGATVSTETVTSFPASLKAPKTPGVYTVKVTSADKGCQSYKLIVR